MIPSSAMPSPSHARLGNRLLACAPFALLVGCGGKGEPPAVMPDLGFAINGHSFVKQKEAAGMAFKNTMPPTPEGWIVELYNQDLDGCAQFRSNGSFGTVLQFHLPLGPNNGPVAVKSYGITLGNTAFIANGDFHAAEPDSGTLDITAADAKHVAGRFEMTFRTRERYAASFDAPVCP